METMTTDESSDENEIHKQTAGDNYLYVIL